ncbi:MAG: class I SAM-dependent methyltransferase [Chloroflexi bacterium]|nr:class I SAM-dependent methyltransferase [Chloroflexota bacterium]MCI0647018.1 class I SAM-dependent methyltransferase [Chloroflexota bacterium]MCI0730718.1 class I SAM-dependent methyltransferase [Chloroflexota bacterium]
MNDTNQLLARILWKIYHRPARPTPWTQGGNLPWDEPAFSRRMLRQHLDDSHGAASRATAEREMQLAWLWGRLRLRPGARLLDVTCGPGLYAVELTGRGCQVTGVDFSPASIAYAREVAEKQGLAGRCTFIEQDVRLADFGQARFDVALLLYGQLAVFSRTEAQALLEKIVRALRPGGRLCLELLDQDRVDKANSTWWFTDDGGLWGDMPFLHLGERFWLAEEEMSVEHYQIVHLESGRLDEIILCDQTYAVETMAAMLRAAGFSSVDAYPAWDGLPLYDAAEWVVYIAEKP